MDPGLAGGHEGLRPLPEAIVSELGARHGRHDQLSVRVVQSGDVHGARWEVGKVGLDLLVRLDRLLGLLLVLLIDGGG